MIPVKQTEFYPNGNCMQACIASLLELPLEQVIPIHKHFNTSEDWGKILKDWFVANGYEFVPANEFNVFHTDTLIATNEAEGNIINDVLLKRKELCNQFYMISGTSPRHVGSTHCVIYQNGKLVHDPHPDNTSVLQIHSFMKIVPAKRKTLLNDLTDKYEVEFKDNDIVTKQDIENLIKKTT